MQLLQPSFVRSGVLWPLPFTKEEDGRGFFAPPFTKEEAGRGFFAPPFTKEEAGRGFFAPPLYEGGGWEGVKRYFDAGGKAGRRRGKKNGMSLCW